MKRKKIYPEKFKNKFKKLKETTTTCVLMYVCVLMREQVMELQKQNQEETEN
jgi:hypothetical protein